MAANQATPSGETPKTKAQAIRDALAADENGSPKEIAERLTAAGLNVKPNDVSQIKLRLKKIPKPGYVVAETPKEVPAMDESLDLVSLDSLLLAKKLVQQMGGVQQAQKALTALAELLD